MKKALLAVMAVFMAAAIVTQAKAEEKKTITIVAEEAGGGWYAYSATISKILEANTPYKVEIIPRGGGIANPSFLEKGKADFGFTTSNAVAWARDGLEVVYRGNKHENIRGMIGAMQNAYQVLLVRDAYLKKTGNDTIEKMLKSDNPPIILTEPTGSQDPIIVDFMLKSMGSSLEQERKRGTVVQISSSQMSEYIKDGKADVFIANGPQGHSTTTEVALSNVMHPVLMSDNMLKALNNAGMPTAILPANIYKGQTEEYRTAVSATIFITHADVDEEVVYNVTKALVENVEQLQKEHAPLRMWNPELGAQPEQTIIDLHPGALRYYKERGWLK